MDVGGTLIKLGIVRGKRILLREEIRTRPVSGSPSRLEDGVIGAAAKILGRFPGKISAAGVGIPGMVLQPGGIVVSCANLPGWRRVPLQRRLRRRLRMPVAVDNDANLMALAEWTYGAGSGTENLLCVTLGTGVGGGLVLAGSLYHNRFGSAGELGHMPAAERGPRCSCGGSACLERYVGNREVVVDLRRRLRRGAPSCIPKLVGGDLGRITPEIIDRACEMGDPLACRIWREAGERIGFVLAGVMNLIGPDRVVIGGGIAGAGRWLFGPIRRTVRARVIRPLKRVPVLPARLGSSAGLVGAALLARRESA